MISTLHYLSNKRFFKSRDKVQIQKKRHKVFESHFNEQLSFNLKLDKAGVNSLADPISIEGPEYEKTTYTLSVNGEKFD